tara:strand:- start:369 stop:662 length:294 start_codon:yes stop_codon:yes gene_type:complete
MQLKPTRLSNLKYGDEFRFCGDPVWYVFYDEEGAYTKEEHAGCCGILNIQTGDYAEQCYSSDVLVRERTGAIETIEACEQSEARAWIRQNTVKLQGA